MTNKNKKWILYFHALFLTIIFFVFIIKSASATTLNNEENQQIQSLIKETQALRKEISQLKLNTQTEKRSHTKKVHSKTKKNNATNPEVSHGLLKSIPDIDLPPQTKNPLTLGSSPVVINPYLGVPIAYNGTQLLANLALQNSELLVLQYRQEIENTFSDVQPKASDYYLVLSGAVNMQADYIRPFVPPQLSDIDLNSINVTALGGVGKWVTTFISFDFDPVAPDELEPPGNGARASNSRVFLDQGFLAIGNLERSDWYLSAGQMYLPFGKFNSFMINSPMTESLFIFQERPALLGYSHNFGTTEFDAEAYGYQGETSTKPDTAVINEWGVTADYLISRANWDADVGLGYISNIVDSGAMLQNGNSSQDCKLFAGYSFPCRTSNILVHRVPGFSIHGNLSIKDFSFIGEFLTATRSFAIIDMNFNDHGARPRAFDVEASYAFSFLNKPSNIAAGYSGTHQALAMLLAAKEYSLVFNTSIWRNTIESIGFQHDINYGVHDFVFAQDGLRLYVPADEINKGRISNVALIAITVAF